MRNVVHEGRTCQIPSRHGVARARRHIGTGTGTSTSTGTGTSTSARSRARRHEHVGTVTGTKKSPVPFGTGENFLEAVITFVCRLSVVGTSTSARARARARARDRTLRHAADGACFGSRDIVHGIPCLRSTGCAHVKTIAWEVCACKSTHGTGTSAQFRDVERASRRERFDKPIFTGTARHGTARHGTARHGTGTKK